MPGRSSGEGGPHVPKPYNPLEKQRLAESIVRELLDQPPNKLPPAEPFIGAGIYVIYFKGDFDLYERLSKLNAESPSHPIYVGRAVSPGGRKGGFSDPTMSRALYTRLAQHASSVQQSDNLNLDDFLCRFLVVDEFWIGLAESLLIEKYQPLWNCVLDGFGNHDPGAGRHQGKRPNWDTLHPGRTWSQRLQVSALTLDQIKTRISNHLEGLPR